MVALAMIGVLPVLPPVEAVEVRLRHWTHRAVGIPLTIYRHSEAMRSHLRQTSGVNPGELPDFDKDIPPWVKDVADRYSINHAFQAKTDLDRLIRWTMTGRGEWPTGETNRAVEALFDERTAAAQKAVHEFEVQVLRKNLATPPKAVRRGPSHQAPAGLGAGVGAGDRGARRAPGAACRRRREAVGLRPDQVGRSQGPAERGDPGGPVPAGTAGERRPAHPPAPPRLRIRRPLRLALSGRRQRREELQRDRRLGALRGAPHRRPVPPAADGRAQLPLLAAAGLDRPLARSARPELRAARHGAGARRGPPRPRRLRDRPRAPRDRPGLRFRPQQPPLHAAPLRAGLRADAARGQPRGGLGHLLPDGALRDGGEGARRRPAQARLDGLSLRAGDPRLPDAAPLLLVRRRRLLEVRHDLSRASAAEHSRAFPQPLRGRAGVAQPMHRGARAAGILALLQPRLHPDQHGDRLPVDRVLPARSPTRASALPGARGPPHRARPPGSCC